MAILKINKNILISSAILALALLVSYAIVAQAVSKDDITYPVVELGGCENETECRSYCDSPDNYSACFAFAKKHNLISGPLTDKSEADLERFAQTLKRGGPGGCQDQRSCESYCNNIDNIDTCLAFAETHDLIPPKELAEAKQIKTALAQGAQLPGGCRNKDACESYCNQPGNEDECLAFAEAAGFIAPEEREEARKAMQFMARGETPGGCRSKAACESYCDNDNNFKECIAFAEKAGFMSKAELEMAKKTGGKGPGDCRGRACETYCEDENNFDVCIAFAEEHGLISEQELEMVKKTGGKGPGGCKGRACETFCNDPTNQEVCFQFAQEHGLLREEDKARIEEGKRGMMEALNNAPPEVAECLSNKLGSDFAEKVRSGNFVPGPAVGEQMRSCFDQHFGGQQGGPPSEFRDRELPQGFGGPGGCQTPEECRAFCQNNPEECRGFGPPGDHQDGTRGDFLEPGRRPGEFPPPDGLPNFPPPGEFSDQHRDFPPTQEFINQFQPGTIPSPDQIQQFQQQFEQQRYEGTQEQFQQQFEEQYRQEYQQQYQEQEQYQQQQQQYQEPYTQEQYQQFEQHDGYQQPSSDGSYTPPPTDQHYDENYQEPYPSEPTYSEPPPPEPAPSGGVIRESFLANIVQFVFGLFY